MAARALLTTTTVIANGHPVIVCCVMLAAAYVFFKMFAARTPGPAGTERLVDPGDPNYYQKMRALWGGPAPKHFPTAWDSWVTTHSGHGKVALVTGGTGGVGFYVAKLLARLGYELVLPARSGFEAEASGSALAIRAAVSGAKITVPSVTLDLESLRSVRAFACTVRQQFDRIDLLCLNAGRGGSAAYAREQTGDGLEEIMQVNVVSHFLLTAELLPLLRASPAARVVSQTSRQRLCKTPGFSTAARDVIGCDSNGVALSLFYSVVLFATGEADGSQRQRRGLIQRIPPVPAQQGLPVLLHAWPQRSAAKGGHRPCVGLDGGARVRGHGSQCPARPGPLPILCPQRLGGYTVPPRGRLPRGRRRLADGFGSDRCHCQQGRLVHAQNTVCWRTDPG